VKFSDKTPRLKLPRIYFAVFLLLASSIRAVSAVSTEDTVSPDAKKVLARMDEAGKTLVDLTANIREVKVTLVVNDISESSGKLFLKRTRNGNRTKLEYEKPDVKTLLIDKGKVLIYQPKINTVQEVELGKNRAQAEFFLTGVGQSSANMTSTYDVRFLKEEVIDGNKTSLLELKPKSEKVSSMFTKIWLWVDYTHGIPIQTRLTESSGDHLTIQLENIQVNPKLSEKIFKLNLPSEVQRIKPLSAQ
jgi:outer membrane lipoprotein-sorting protein